MKIKWFILGIIISGCCETVVIEDNENDTIIYSNMAYPVVEATTNGLISDGFVSRHIIPLPSGLVKDEYILIFLATENAGFDHIYSSSGNFYAWANTAEVYSDTWLVCISGKANGGVGGDYLTVDYNNGSYLRYIIYRISGHGMYSNLDIAYNVTTPYDIGQFPIPGIAVGDSGVDKLFIATIAHAEVCTSLSAASGYTNVIYNPEPTQNTGNSQCSIGSARLESTSAILSSTYWDNTPTNYTQGQISIIVRIKSGPLPTPSSTGFGILIQNGRIGGE